mgnify:CR=1 FL=1
MKRRKKIMSLLLCGVLTFSLVSQTVLAAGSTENVLSLEDGLEEPEQLADECVCTERCTGENINSDCPVCGAEGADLMQCKGEETQSEEPSEITDPAVSEVQELINALPMVEDVQGMGTEEKQTVRERVEAAQKAYDALTEEQQVKVTGAEIFEELLAALEETSESAKIIDSGTFGDNDCLSWSLDENGVLTVTGVENMPEGSWNDQYGYSTSEIPWDIYKDQIVEVVVSGGITAIPGGTFKDYTNLLKVTLSDKIKALGGGTFSGCTNLETINLPNTIMYIGDSAFANCRNLILTKLPSNLQYLGEVWGCTFENCTKITSIALPVSLTTVAEYAFRGCTGLKIVELPSGLKNVFGDGVFNGCTGLETVKFSGGSEYYIWPNAFSNCTGLKNIEFPNDSDFSISSGAFSGCTGLESIKFSNSSEYSIGSEVFKDCTNLTSIELPNDSEYSFGTGVFSGCTGLETIEFPIDLNLSISEEMFAGCTGLETIKFSSRSHISINERAFEDCEKLKNIEFSDDLTRSSYTIRENAFHNCTGLISLELPQNVNSIGKEAFSGCVNLEKLSFDGDAPYLEKNVFEGCEKLTIYIPAGATGYTEEDHWPVELIAHPITVQNDGKGTASASSTAAKSGEEVTLTAKPNSSYQFEQWEVVSGDVTIEDNKFIMPMSDVVVKAIFRKAPVPGEVASGTFGENDCLSWSLDENGVLTVTGIDDMPYCEWNSKDNSDLYDHMDFIPWEQYKDEIVEVIVNGGITSIPVLAFNESKNLKTVTLSDKVVTIGNRAFENCTNLEDINLPDDMWFLGGGVFRNCENLVLIELPSNLELIGGDFGHTFENCTSLEKIIIPDKLTYIDECGFKGCTNLTSIEFSNNLEEIYYEAFQGCTNLTSIEFPDTLRVIYDEAFSGCTNLAVTELPSNLEAIGEGAFTGCTNLAVTELPSNLGSIGKEAFKGCANLALSRLPARVTFVGEYAFQDCTNLTMMKLPGDLESIETGTFKGCNNLSFVELPDGLRYIEDEAFKGCKNLSTLEIPSSLLLVGQNAFSGCSSLASLDLPKNLDSIESGAFDGCTNLEELTFDGKVAPLIDANIFDDCEDLTIYIPAGAVGYTKENHWPEELIAHPITVQDDGRGTASASRTGAKAGTEIILIAKPDEGYQFDKWEVVSGGITIKDDTFTMPMGDVTVKARFEKASDQEQEEEQYRTLHFDTNGGSSLGFVMEKEGTLVSLTYYIPVRTGYQFTGWYADAKLTKKITSIRLDENKIVYAGWEKAETDTREEQEISMTNPLQVRDLKNGTRTTSSKACTLKLGFKVNDPDLELAYTTSDPSVATVKDGKITYQGIGTCTITVKAEETNNCKEASLAITVKVGSLGTPSFTPTVSSKTAAKAFTVTSSTVRGVDGWEVQYSIRNDFWKPVTKDFPETGTKLYRETCTTMQSNRTYYIHVRGYQMIDGEKIYSNWSPVKTVVTK